MYCLGLRVGVIQLITRAIDVRNIQVTNAVSAVQNWLSFDKISVP